MRSCATTRPSAIERGPSWVTFAPCDVCTTRRTPASRAAGTPYSSGPGAWVWTTSGRIRRSARNIVGHAFGSIPLEGLRSASTTAAGAKSPRSEPPGVMLTTVTS